MRPGTYRRLSRFVGQQRGLFQKAAIGAGICGFFAAKVAVDMRNERAVGESIATDAAFLGTIAVGFAIGLFAGSMLHVYDRTRESPNEQAGLMRKLAFSGIWSLLLFWVPAIIVGVLLAVILLFGTGVL